MNKKIIASLTAAMFLTASCTSISVLATNSKSMYGSTQQSKQSMFDINTIIKKVMGTVKDSKIVPKANVNAVIASVKNVKKILNKCYTSGKDLSNTEYTQVLKNIKNINYSYFYTANNYQLLNLFTELDGLYTLYNNFKKAGSAKFNKVYLALGINKYVINTSISNFVFGVQNLYNVYQSIAPVLKNFDPTDLSTIKDLPSIKNKLGTIKLDQFESINPEGLIKRANLYELVSISHSIVILKQIADVIAGIQQKINKAGSMLPF